MPKQIKKLIPFLLLFLIAFSFTKTVKKNLNQYQQPFNQQQLSDLYNQSQFAPKPEDRRLVIDDHDLYAYSGWHYLNTGKLETVNIEHPPLGKYLIGLSIIIFNQQNIGQLFWGGLFLILFYFLSEKSLKNNSLSLLVVFFFSLEKIFTYQLTHSLLDLPLAVFLLSLFLITKARFKNKNIKTFFQGIFLGLIAGTKYPTLAGVVFLTLVIYFLLKKEDYFLSKITKISLIGLIVFLSFYYPFFKTNNLASFIDLQIKALKIHLSHLPEYPKGQVVKVLLFNRWLTWWEIKNILLLTSGTIFGLC